jgi:DNA-directed RNA polymerase subunit omega
MARITIEDCIEAGYNKFELVHMATKRIIQLRKGKTLLVPTNNKEIVASLREIAAGKILKREPGSLPAQDLFALESVKESLPADHSLSAIEAGESFGEDEVGKNEQSEMIDEEDDAAADENEDVLNES